MDPKTAPYGPQDGIKIDLEAILRGFDVRTLKRTIRPVWQVGRGRKIFPSWAYGRRVGRRVNPPPTDYNVIDYKL